MSCAAFARGAHCDCSPCCMCAPSLAVLGKTPEPLTFEGIAAQMAESRARAEAADAELLRQERHHDMVCIVIDALVKDALIRGASQLSAANHKAIAQQYADTIFPPPTETK